MSLVANDITTLSYTPSDLSNGTKYYWKVVATDSNGNSTSSIMNFTALVDPVSLEWSYEFTNDVRAVSISSDGEYIAIAAYDEKVYLFEKDNNVPLWSYDTGMGDLYDIAISADGKYFVAGTENDNCSGMCGKVYRVVIL